mmetsp:Transcript_130853/g.226608  ORF Transcript_130853/g.226608 Transcript_130853/m.226608 type:complete len:509 (-) Transcript_130853:175-1701(-)
MAQVLYDFYISSSAIPATDTKVFGYLAQEENEDAMDAANAAVRAYKGNGDKGSKAFALCTVAEVYIVTGDPEQAQKLANEAYEYFVETKNEGGQARAQLVLAKAQLSEFGVDAALESVEDVIALASRIADIHLEAISLYTVASWQAVFKGSTESANGSANKMMALFSDDTKEYSMALLLQADIFNVTGKYQSAFTVASKAAENFEKLGMTGKQATAVLVACSAGFASGSSSKAYTMADDGFALYNKVGDTKGHASLQIEVAKARLRDEEYSAAEEVAEDALVTCKKYDYEAKEADVLTLLSSIRLAMTIADQSEEDVAGEDIDTESATEAAMDALVIYRNLKNRNGQAQALMKLAQVRYFSAAVDMARMAADDAQMIFRDTGDKSGEGAAVMMIAQVYLAEEAFEQAKRTANKALMIFQKCSDQEGVDQANAFLEEIKEKQINAEVEGKKSKKIESAVTPQGIIRVETKPDDARHLLSYFAEMNDQEENELSTFDISAWANADLSLTA